MMEITIVGSGDAFGSGGRLNTCFHVQARRTSFLIDCGATSLPAIKQLGIERNAIDFILVTHFHADHFGGIPPFVLDAQLLAKRCSSLTIAGPPGLEEWFQKAMDTAFPGSAVAPRKFEISLVELRAGDRVEIHGVQITPQFVRHGGPEGPFFGYRVELDERVIAYTGDTEWTESLIHIARNADLLIAEAYFFEKQIPFHLDYITLKRQLPRMSPKQVLLTHMNDDMLSHAADVPEEKAHDGLILHI